MVTAPKPMFAHSESLSLLFKGITILLLTFSILLVPTKGYLLFRLVLVMTSITTHFSTPNTTNDRLCHARLLMAANSLQYTP